MSTGAIVAISVVGLLGALFVPIRIDVARQRRAVEIVRARLAAARVRRRAENVPVSVVQQLGRHVTRVSRASTVALADDGLYCLSDDGRWGGRIRFGPGADGPGDIALTTSPALVKGGRLVGADAPEWLASELAALPAEGLLFQVAADRTWFVALPEPGEWYGALAAAVMARQ